MWDCRRRCACALLVASLSLPLPITVAHTAEVALEMLSIAELQERLASGTLTSERLVKHSLARIAAYDDAGSHLNAVMVLNKRAIETARALDAERKRRGPRGALHGIPVVVKDNIDTADLPTTAGSVLLEGSIPPDDAAVVKKLRAAGAVILAKVNMSEFALGYAFSSLGGQMRNPHDPTRSPAGSSGGTGVAIAGAYAPLGLGTDTGGSIRAPSAANGIVGFKPSYGLISRDGIIPLALTLDTVGPMTRHVADVAIALDVLAGVDQSDAATRIDRPTARSTYVQSLDAHALRGARIGFVRNFMGQDRDVQWVTEAALRVMRAQGAEVVDVEFPAWLMGDELEQYYGTIVGSEFTAQIGSYLQTLAADFPKSLDELASRADQFRSVRADGAGPNPQRWSGFRSAAAPLDDYRYVIVRDHALPLVREVVTSMLKANSLDALVYPTADVGAQLIAGRDGEGSTRPFVDCIANLGGFPELVVPAGFTERAVPVALSFLGARFDDARVLSIGYSFEQVTHAIRLPKHTPPLVARKN